MVTLQILVLSFLVRIQVAQLKRLSVRGSFFCFMFCNMVVSIRLFVSSSCNENRLIGQNSR